MGLWTKKSISSYLIRCNSIYEKLIFYQIEKISMKELKIASPKISLKHVYSVRANREDAHNVRQYLCWRYRQLLSLLHYKNHEAGRRYITVKLFFARKWQLNYPSLHQNE